MTCKRGWRRCGSYSPLQGRNCARFLGGRCYRPCWIGRSRESCESDPIPSFPQVGEGELRVYMRRKTIDSKVQMRLASPTGMVSLRESQSATEEELRLR